MKLLNIIQIRPLFMNLMRNLNMGKIYMKPQFLKFGDLLGGGWWKLAINAKYKHSMCDFHYI